MENSQNMGTGTMNEIRQRHASETYSKEYEKTKDYELVIRFLL